AAVAHRSNAVDGFIAAVAGGDDELAWLVPRAEERTPVIRVWNRDAAGIERGRVDVERGAWLVSNSAGFRHTGPSYDERHVGAVIVQPLLAAQQAPTVVAE